MPKYGRQSQTVENNILGPDAGARLRRVPWIFKPKDQKQNGRSILISENNACVQLYCLVYQPDKTDFFLKFNFPHPLFIL